MTFDLFEVEKAMNLIKEEVVKDLSDSVIKQAHEKSLETTPHQSFFCEVD